jgi:hypothetical protein
VARRSWRAPTRTTATRVALNTALGRTTTHQVQRLSVEQRTITAPTGLLTVTQKRTDGSRTTTSPDGTVTTLVQGPDPRFGMEAALPASQAIAVPDGPTSTLTTARAVSLSDPDDPLSLTSSTDTVTVNGQAFTTSFDAASSSFTSTTPEGRQTVTTIDAQGRPLSTQVTGILPVVRSYDTHGRLSTITQGSDSAARVTTFGYRSSDGFLGSITDALGRTVTFDT